MRSRLIYAFAVILLMVSPAFSDEYEEKFVAFGKSIAEAADRICWSSEYNFQDVEFVENEMLGDERVYARAWYDDYYLVIRKYQGKDWSDSHISDFWTSSEELSFVNGIKIGSPLSKLEAYFGKEHVYSTSPGIYRAAQFEESDGGGMLIFSVDDGTITSIGFYMLDNQTSKMHFLFNIYALFRLAEITGEKVNVREYSPAGSVKFQVSRSKGDTLLVDREESEGWYSVVGRIVNNTLSRVPYYSISKQFIKARKLTLSERKRFILQTIK